MILVEGRSISPWILLVAPDKVLYHYPDTSRYFVLWLKYMNK